MPVKALLLRLHRWVGLAVGLLVILQGLSGMAIAFRHELNRTLHHDALVVAPPAAPAPLSAVSKAAKAAFPDRRLTRIDYPVTRDDAYLARLETPGGSIAYAAVDPGTARVTRQGPLSAWPVEWLYQLHMSLLSGDTGERVVGFTGLGLLFMALTGPFVWWPGAFARVGRALGVDLRSGAWRGARDLHRLAGILAVPVLLVSATTGLLMAWQPWLSPAVSLIAPVGEGGAPKPLPGACAKRARLEDAVAAAAARHPGQSIKSVRFPGKGKVVAVYFRALNTGDARATDHVWVDACKAVVLKEKGALTEPAGSRFFNGLLWVHTGEWLGIVGRVLVALAAACAVTLGVSGFVQWATRTAKARRARAARAAKAG